MIFAISCILGCNSKNNDSSVSKFDDIQNEVDPNRTIMLDCDILSTLPEKNELATITDWDILDILSEKTGIAAAIYFGKPIKEIMCSLYPTVEKVALQGLKNAILTNDYSYLLLYSDSKFVSGNGFHPYYGNFIEFNLNDGSYYSGEYREEPPHFNDDGVKFNQIILVKKCKINYSDNEWLIDVNDLNKFTEEEINYVLKYFAENKPDAKHNNVYYDLCISIAYNPIIGHGVRNIIRGYYSINLSNLHLRQ